MRLLLALIAAVPVALTATPPTEATSTGNSLIAFVHHDNVSIAGPDGSGAQQLTSDGTGTRIVHQRQVTYQYLMWSPDHRRLLVARFESDDPPGGRYRQGWSLETWVPGSRGFVSLVSNINAQDFMPRWSADGRSILYTGASSYDDKTLRFDNAVKIAMLSRRVVTLTHFRAHEGCLDTSTDPSELTFWNLVGPGGIRQTFLWSGASHVLVYATECIHTGLTYRNLTTGRQRMVGRLMTEAALSPNGIWMVGVEQSGLVLLHPDGTGRRVFPATVGARLPVWSPDGRSVYYLVRHRVRLLRYRDHDGNPFEIQVNRASIAKLDVASGRITVLVTEPMHAFASLDLSPDGKWLYFTRVTNSDHLYSRLVHGSRLTTTLLTRYGPRIDVVRVPSSGGAPQPVAEDSGQVAVSGSTGKS